jgi:hypothetical protein
MSILHTKTEAESDLAAKDQLVLQVAEATHHLATTLKNTNDQFWSLPTDRLLAVLNDDVTSTLATFAANTAIGQTVNNSLDALALPQYQTRAPLTAGRSDIQLDSGSFILIPTKPDEPIIDSELI